MMGVVKRGQQRTLRNLVLELLETVVEPTRDQRNHAASLSRDSAPEIKTVTVCVSRCIGVLNCPFALLR